MQTQFVCKDNILVKEMLSQCSAIRVDQSESYQKFHKLNPIRRYMRNKFNYGNVKGRHAMVVSEFKQLKKFSDNEVKMNAVNLIEDFRKTNSAVLDSDDEDEEIFRDFIYQKEEDNWEILFDHLNQFKSDKKMETDETFRALIKSYTSQATYDAINTCMRNSNYQ